MASGSDMAARGVGSAESGDGPCGTEDGFRDVLESLRTLETSLRTFEAEVDRLLSRRTYVILTAAAAAVAPVYLALFAGFGG